MYDVPVFYTLIKVALTARLYTHDNILSENHGENKHKKKWEKRQLHKIQF